MLTSSGDPGDKAVRDVTAAAAAGNDCDKREKGSRSSVILELWMIVIQNSSLDLKNVAESP